MLKFLYLGVAYGGYCWLLTCGFLLADTCTSLGDRCNHSGSSKRCCNDFTCQFENFGLAEGKRALKCRKWVARFILRVSDHELHCTCFTHISSTKRHNPTNYYAMAACSTDMSLEYSVESRADYNRISTQASIVVAIWWTLCLAWDVVRQAVIQHLVPVLGLLLIAFNSQLLGTLLPHNPFSFSTVFRVMGNANLFAQSVFNVAAQHRIENDIILYLHPGMCAWPSFVGNRGS